MLLVFLVLSAIMALAGAMVLPLAMDLHRAAHLHLAFALGIMPLILGSMMHFAPVLTRTRGVEPGVERFGLLAWLGGLLVVIYFALTLPVAARNLAAVISLAACVRLFAWQLKRGKGSLGGAHPGLRWYLAALSCLAAGLLAVLAISLWPRETAAFRNLHLHLNLFGFVGLTAFGTLQVLLPTAAGQPDPSAAARLRADLPLALAGTWLIALGAAWLPPLSWVGLALWALPLWRVALAWLKLHQQRIFQRHGASPLLAAALTGFAAALVAGGLHGAGWVEPAHAGHFWVFAFLFPLVSGAAGHLLPLWLRPGRQGEWHDLARQRLTWGSGARAGLLLAGGGAALAGMSWGALVAMAGLLPFVLLAGWVFLGSRRVRP